MQVGHQHAIGVRAVAEAQLQTEVVTQEDEAVEDFVIADHPGGEHREEYQRGQHYATEGRQALAESLAPDPQAAEREEGQHGGICQGANGVQSAEEDPYGRMGVPPTADEGVRGYRTQIEC